MWADPVHITTLDDILDAATNWLNENGSRINPAKWEEAVAHAKRAMHAADMMDETAKNFSQSIERIRLMSAEPPGRN